jgi:predicted PhzF superfamily epimerase YddE/YHI9
MAKIYQVDAFTTEKFKGNPAVVCLLDRPADDHWMQSIAAEMNLSETAFVFPIPDGFSLRWFTPTIEVDLCGHATLATAHVLFETGVLPANRQARFHTLSGVLTVDLQDNMLLMRFPAEPPKEMPVLPIVSRIFGVTPVYTGQNRFDMLIHVRDADTVTDFVPDFYELSQIPVRGIILTSKSEDPQFDFISRFFAPRVGVNEDSVTGSAHCCLGPYWSKILGKTELRAYQASARGGEVRVQVLPTAVNLGGYAVTVMHGELV